MTVTPAEQPSRLLNLPSELRLQIVDLVLHDWCIWVHLPLANHHRHPKSIPEPGEELLLYQAGEKVYFKMRLPQLAIVCHQLHDEIAAAFPRWWSGASFFCPTPLAFLESLRALHSQGIKNANRIFVYDTQSIVLEVGRPADADPPASDDTPASESTDDASQSDDGPLTLPSDTPVQTLGGLSSPLRARIYLSQILEAYKIHIDELVSWSDRLQVGPHCGLPLVQLTAPYWTTFAPSYANDDAPRQAVVNTAKTELSLEAKKFGWLGLLESGVEDTLIADALETWQVPREMWTSSVQFNIQRPDLAALAPARAELVEQLGPRWAAGVRMARNWGLVEGKVRSVGFREGATVVQLIDEDPRAFFKKLQEPFEGDGLVSL